MSCAVSALLFYIVSNKYIFMLNYENYSAYFETALELDYNKYKENLSSMRHCETALELDYNKYKENLSSMRHCTIAKPLTGLNYRKMLIGNITKNFDNCDVLHFSTDDYIAHLLSSNPMYKVWIRKAFPRLEIYKVIAPKIFKPNDAINKHVEEFKRVNFAKQTVGIHARLHKRFSINMLQNAEYYCKTVEYLLMSIEIAGVSQSVFIATDDNEFREKFRTCMGNYKVVWQKTDMQQKISKNQNPGTKESAVTDTLEQMQRTCFVFWVFIRVFCCRFRKDSLLSYYA